jgi:phosphosulfolactate synthase
MNKNDLFYQELGLELQERSSKPRAKGKTMVMDMGWPVEFVRGALALYGDFIDVVKIVNLALHERASELRRKVAVYRDYDIETQPGGIIIELARWQHVEEEVLRKLLKYGFTALEISTSSTSQRESDEERRFSDLCQKLGFRVYGEVGKKFPGGDKTRVSEDRLNVQETISEFKVLLDSGAVGVYWEGHVLRAVLGQIPEEIMRRRKAAEPEVMEVVQAVGQDKIIFEVSPQIPFYSRRAMQFWLVRLFGPEVNIGNTRLEEIPMLEDTRRGCWPILGFGELGDHPWIRSYVERNGTASPTWWKE